MSKKIHISEDKTLYTHPDKEGKFQLIATLHNASSSDAAVRYWVRPLRDHAPASLSSLQKTPDGAYLAVEQRVGKFSPAAALIAIKNNHQIVFDAKLSPKIKHHMPASYAAGAAENSQDTVKGRSIVLGEYKTTEGFFKVSVVAHARRGTIKIGYYVEPLSKGADEHAIMDKINDLADIKPYGSQLGLVSLDAVNLAEMQNIFKRHSMKLSADDQCDISEKIEKFREEYNFKREAQETDYTRSPLIGAFISTGKNYKLLVRLVPMTKGRPRSGLPYILQYSVKVAEESQNANAESHLEQRWPESLPKNAGNEYLLFEHTVGKDDGHLPAAFLETFRKTIGDGFKDSEVLTQLDHFWDTYLEDTPGTRSALESMRRRTPREL